MNKVSKGEQSKNKIIEAAAMLFLKNGYNATGINDILNEVNLPKGSFYFHFKSKKDLAVQVSGYFQKRLGKLVLKSAEGRNWEEFINVLMEEFIKSAENRQHYGCPFAVLGLEIAFSEPDIAAYYFEALKRLGDIFQKVLKFSGIPENSIKPLASRALAIYEGYLLYYRIGKEVSTLEVMREDLIAIYRECKGGRS